MDASTYESTLEGMIINNIGFVQMRGFPELHSTINRQFLLPTGKVCDIFSYELKDNTFNCKILELKRGELGIAALLQLIEYGELVAKHSVWSFDKVNIELYLIGSEINNELLSLFGWGLNVKLLTYEYKFDGIHFDPFTPLGEFPPPYWLSHPNEMISRPPEDEISSWLSKLKSS